MFLDKERILGQTQHPSSVAKIQQIEAPKPVPQEVPDVIKEVSAFTLNLLFSVENVFGNESLL